MPRHTRNTLGACLCNQVRTTFKTKVHFNPFHIVLTIRPVMSVPTFIYFLLQDYLESQELTVKKQFQAHG